MIRNATARRIMYDWHSGQWSAFYAAASSGLCASFTALALECDGITDGDKSKLLEWIMHKQNNYREAVVCGRAYAVLPWVSRSY